MRAICRWDHAAKHPNAGRRCMLVVILPTFLTPLFVPLAVLVHQCHRYATTVGSFKSVAVQGPHLQDSGIGHVMNGSNIHVKADEIVSPGHMIFHPVPRLARRAPLHGAFPVGEEEGTELQVRATATLEASPHWGVIAQEPARELSTGRNSQISALVHREQERSGRAGLNSGPVHAATTNFAKVEVAQDKAEKVEKSKEKLKTAQMQAKQIRVAKPKNKTEKSRKASELTIAHGRVIVAKARHLYHTISANVGMLHLRKRGDEPKTWIRTLHHLYL